MENPQIVIEKSQRTLKIFDGAKLIKQYNVALGFAALGDKQTEGDGKTPEGEFYVFTKNSASKFHLSLGLSYPNHFAATRGLREKIISPEEHAQILEAIVARKMPPQKTALGGEIYIHGGGVETDWTQGCVALENAEIKELFDQIPIGAMVKILP